MKKRQVLSAVSLTDSQRKQIMEEIAAFYMDERGEELGIIGQQQILDLFTERLAPIVYNKALDDAKRWHQQFQENMEADFYLLYKEI